MQVEKIITKTVTNKETTGHQCDCCGKIHKGIAFPDDWHTFGTHHQDWGNDSIESHKFYDVCSVGCYAKSLSVIIDEDGERYGFEVDEMICKFARRLLEKIS